MEYHDISFMETKALHQHLSSKIMERQTYGPIFVWVLLLVVISQPVFFYSKLVSISHFTRRFLPSVRHTNDRYYSDITL